MPRYENFSLNVLLTPPFMTVAGCCCGRLWVLFIEEFLVERPFIDLEVLHNFCFGMDS